MFDCFKDKEFLRRFAKISMPVMFGAFISFIVSFLDNLMVGGVSNETVSGIYAANQVTFLFDLAAYGLIEGAGIFIQQYGGTKDYDHIKQCSRYKTLATILFLVVVIPLIYLFGDKLIYIYCHTDSNSQIILAEGTRYLNVIAISFIPFCITSILTSTLREMGDTKVVLWSGGVALLTNFIFNFIFIIVLKFGGIGAAVATILSRLFELTFVLIVCKIKKYPYFSFKQALKIDKTLFKEITRKGIILFINELGFACGAVLQSLAFAQRDNVLSAISIVSTISNIFMILVQGLSVGIGVMVGSRLGANEFKEAVDENRKLNLLGVVLSFGAGMILILLSPVLPKLFREVNAEQKVLATKLIIIYSSLLWANCLSLTAYYTLKVGGNTFTTLLFDTGVMFMLYIPISWILAVLTNLDLLYIYFIVRALDVVKAIFGIILVRKGGWVKNITV